MRICLLLAALLAAAAPAISQPWPAGTPASEGLDPIALETLDLRIKAGDFGFVNRVVVMRNGLLVFNATYPQDFEAISAGRENAIGCGYGCQDPSWDHQFNYLHPDWHPFHQGTDVHTLQSVTKSVAATVLATAMHNGAIGSVDEPLLAYLTAYDLTGLDPRLQDATLEDLLTMRTGIEWHETDRPMDMTNTTIALERADDWVRFTLAQPMDAAPGEKWVYNSGGSHLMAAIVQQATGQRMDAYAEEHLFGPLGIEDYHWKITPAGLPDALGGLYLEAIDLAKIGMLYLRDGVWEGQRLLPEGWVQEATSKHVESPGYGYQWWRPDPGGVEVWAGQGFGDQYLLVLPDYDTVAVINSWNLLAGRRANLRNALVGVLAN
ncbi:MAG: serine hydrolase [Rhodothermales bacterium]|nr:serine hydrolase [Rhodothermales bacterium]MBO6778655.1 serine hydrolase [Rhodothermales bacterium]